MRTDEPDAQASTHLAAHQLRSLNVVVPQLVRRDLLAQRPVSVARLRCRVRVGPAPSSCHGSPHRGSGNCRFSLVQLQRRTSECAGQSVEPSDVGFHPFSAGASALMAAAVSATGFVRGTRTVRAEKRAKASIKGSGADVTPAG